MAELARPGDSLVPVPVPPDVEPMVERSGGSARRSWFRGHGNGDTPGIHGHAGGIRNGYHSLPGGGDNQTPSIQDVPGGGAPQHDDDDHVAGRLPALRPQSLFWGQRPRIVKFQQTFVYYVYAAVGWPIISNHANNAPIRDQFEERKLSWDALKEEVEGEKCKCLFKMLWTAFVVSVILLASVLQILLCLRRDTINIHRKVNECRYSNETICRLCEDGLAEFLIPDFLILIAYTVSFFVVFKKQEFIPYLVQKLYDHSPDNAKATNCKTAGRWMGFQVCLGGAWLFYSFLVTIFILVARSKTIHNTPPIIFETPTNTLIFLEVLCSFMFIAFDLVYITIIIDYSFQCQLLISIINVIKTNFDSRDRDSISKFIKGIEEVKVAVYNQLNRYTSWNVSTMMFIFTISILYGVIALYELGPIEQTHRAARGGNTDNMWVLSSTMLNLGQWITILIIPLVQAARLTAAFASLKAIRAQPHDDELPELKEFRLYISSQNLRAKLVCLPISPGAVAGVLFVIACTLIVITQTNFFSWTPSTL